MTITGVAIEQFDSPTAVLHAAMNRPINQHWQGEKRASKKHEMWGAVRSFEEATEKAHEGFTEVTDEMKQTYNTSKAYVNERIKPRQVMPINSYIGSTPNVTRAILGLPKDMRKMRMESRKVPGIEIVYEAGLNCSFEDEELKERGARMLVLLSLFAMHNIPVRLSISTTVLGFMKDSDKAYMSKYIIQDYGETMNIRKVSYWLAHPSMFRRISFAIWETSPVVERYSYGYGRPVANYEDDCEFLRKHFKEQSNAYFLSVRDFLTDDDIIRVWNQITGGDNVGESH